MTKVAPGWLDPPGWAGAHFSGARQLSSSRPQAADLKQPGAEWVGEARLQAALSRSALHR